jgi:DNA-binding response OmpR family regulator
MVQSDQGVRAVTTSDGTVVVLDDDPAVPVMLGRMLQAHGFSAMTASTVAEATAIAGQTPVSAFILDIALGAHESGLDLLPWLRRQRRYAMTPIFILTGKFDVTEEEQKQMQRHRAYLFYKGQSMQLLMDYLRRLLVDPNRD